MGNTNEVNGSTEWVRTLEDRLCARPIQLFVVGGKTYSADVLCASDGDKWIAKMNQITDAFNDEQVVNAIKQNYTVEKYRAKATELERAANEGSLSVDYDALFVQRIQIWEEQKEALSVMIDALSELRAAYQSNLLDCVFSYDPDIESHRDEIIEAGLTEEQTAQASQRLWFSTDPTKVRQSLELQIKAAHGLS